MKFSPSTVLALAAVVATGTAFTPLSTPSKAAVGVVSNNSKNNNYNAFRRPVSFLKSTETEEPAPANAETYEYVPVRGLARMLMLPSKL